VRFIGADAVRSVVQRLVVSCFALASLSMAANGCAGIVLKGTRFVYPAQEKEITATLINQGKAPVLIRTWLDVGDPKSVPETTKVPFTLTPPVFRMEPAKEMALRLAYTGDSGLPADRESLYWLNVLEVPSREEREQASAKSTMQLAFRYRLKLFFRPEGLSGDAKDAASDLSWSLVPSDKKGADLVLRATNNKPYFVSLAKVALIRNGHEVTAVPDTVAPYSHSDLKLKASPVDEAFAGVHDSCAVDYQWINEWGGFISQHASLAKDCL
jgi:chaperone protein EcpD